MATLDCLVKRVGIMVCARKHRYRTRNLHDGRPVPPARMPATAKTPQQAFRGDIDRCDAIVGYDAYVTSEGGELGIYLAYKSGRGVNRAIPRIEAMNGTVKQVGDFEIAGTVPVDQPSGTTAATQARIAAREVILFESGGPYGYDCGLKPDIW